MKKILLALLITSFAFTATAQPGKRKVKKKVNTETTTKTPKVVIAKKDSIGNIKFTKTKHDFGKIPQGTPVTYTFKFVNSNPSAVTINNAKASCGCTTPNYSKEPIPAGGTGTMTVRYNAAATGVFNKSITVDTNLGTIVLYISGVVQAKPAEPTPTPIKIGGSN